MMNYMIKSNDAQAVKPLTTGFHQSVSQSWLSESDQKLSGTGQTVVCYFKLRLMT